MSEVKRLEQQRAGAVELLERREMALRLAENRDFRKLFIEEYFVTEAARMVQMSSDPALTKEQQGDALEMARASGHTKRYLSMIIQMATVAERDMEELDETLRQAREEEDVEENALAAGLNTSADESDPGEI